MYQFIHIDIYAKQVSQKAIKRRIQDNKTGSRSLLNVRQIIAEAKRETGACPHVANPIQPTHIYGLQLDDVEALAYQSTEEKTDTKKRKLRIDTPILLAGIASYPREMFDENKVAFKQWLESNVEWLKNEYGENLKNITLHLDEAHPHIHFYAVSPTGKVKDIHVGYLSEREIHSEHIRSSDRENAYKKAMMDFQLRYYNEVGAPNGLLKTGPRKQRLSRVEYQAKKNAAKLIASKQYEIEQMDKIIADELFLKYQDVMVQAESEAKKRSADYESSFLKKLFAKSDSIINSARLEAKRIIDEAARISKNAYDVIEKLMKAEKRISELESELEIVKEERDMLKGASEHSKKF